MKKTSIISLIIFIVAVVLLALMTTQNTHASKLIEPSDNTVYFTISGCDNCSGNVTCCVDGGPTYYFNSCKFGITLSSGQHTICVSCPNRKAGTSTFTVVDDDQTQWVNVVVSSGMLCSCTDKKK